MWRLRTAASFTSSATAARPTCSCGLRPTHRCHSIIDESIYCSNHVTFIHSCRSYSTTAAEAALAAIQKQSISMLHDDHPPRQTGGTSHPYSTPTTTKTATPLHKRGSFPTLRPPVVAPSTAGASLDAKKPQHLLLLHRLDQLVQEGRNSTMNMNQPATRTGGGKAPNAGQNRIPVASSSTGPSNHHQEICLIIRRLVVEGETERVKRQINQQQSKPTTPTNRSSQPNEPQSELGGNQYSLIINALRDLPVEHLPVDLVNAVWYHMSQSQTKYEPESVDGSKSPTASPSPSSTFRPPIRSVNQIIDLYSSLGDSDSAWRIWQYIRQHDITPTIITINTMHTAILRGMSSRQTDKLRALDKRRFEEIWQTWEQIGPGNQYLMNNSSTLPTELPPLFHPIRPHLSTSKQIPAPTGPGFVQSFDDSRLFELLAPPFTSYSSHGDMHFRNNVLLFFNQTGQPFKAAYWACHIHGSTERTIELDTFRTCSGSIEKYLRMRAEAKSDYVSIRTDAIICLNQLLWHYFTVTMRLQPDLQLVAQEMRILDFLKQRLQVLSLAHETILSPQIKLKSNQPAYLVAHTTMVMIKQVLDSMNQPDGIALASFLKLAVKQQKRPKKTKSNKNAPNISFPSPSPLPSTLLTPSRTAKHQPLIEYVRQRILVTLTKSTDLFQQIDANFLNHLLMTYQRQYQLSHEVEAFQLSQRMSQDTKTHKPIQLKQDHIWLIFEHIRTALLASPSSTSTSTNTPTNTSNPPSMNIRSLITLDFFEIVLNSLHYTLPPFQIRTDADVTTSMKRARLVLDTAIEFYTPQLPKLGWMGLRSGRHAVTFVHIINAYLSHLSHFSTASMEVDRIWKEWFLPGNISMENAGNTDLAVLRGNQARLTTTKLLPNKYTLQPTFAGYMRGGRVAEIPSVLRVCKDLFSLELDSSAYQFAIEILEADVRLSNSFEEKTQLALAALNLYREMTNRHFAPTSGLYTAFMKLLLELSPSALIPWTERGVLEPPWRVQHHLFREMLNVIDVMKSPKLNADKSLIQGQIMPFNVHLEHILPVVLGYEKAVNHAFEIKPTDADTLTLLNRLVHEELGFIRLMIEREVDARDESPTHVRGIAQMYSSIVKLLVRLRSHATVAEPNFEYTTVPNIGQVSVKSTPLIPALLSLYNWCYSRSPVHAKFIEHEEWSRLMDICDRHMQRLKALATPDAQAEMAMSNKVLKSFMEPYLEREELTSSQYATLMHYYTFMQPDTEFKAIWNLFTRSQLAGVVASTDLIRELFLSLAHFKQYSSMYQLYRNMLSIDEVKQAIPDLVHNSMMNWMGEWAAAIPNLPHIVQDLKQELQQISDQRLVPVPRSVDSSPPPSPAALVRSPFVAARQLFHLRSATTREITPPVAKKPTPQPQPNKDANGDGIEINDSLSSITTVPSTTYRRTITCSDYWQFYQILQLQERLIPITTDATSAAPSTSDSSTSLSSTMSLVSTALPGYWERFLTSEKFWPHGRTQFNYINLVPLIQPDALTSSTPDTNPYPLITPSSTSEFDSTLTTQVGGVLNCVMEWIRLRYTQYPDKAHKDIYIRIGELELVDESTNANEIDEDETEMDSSETNDQSTSLLTATLNHLNSIGVASSQVIHLTQSEAASLFPPLNSKAPSMAFSGRYVKLQKQLVEDLIRTHHSRITSPAPKASTQSID